MHIGLCAFGIMILWYMKIFANQAKLLVCIIGFSLVIETQSEIQFKIKKSINDFVCHA